MIYKRIVKLLDYYIVKSKKSNSAIQQYNNIEPQRGFTLIELLVAISISAVLGTVGIAGFTTFNQNQVLETSANDLTTTLSLAKSRAQSQVKFGTCGPNCTLTGYAVNIDTASGEYTLSLNRLSNPPIYIETKTLPSALVFNDSLGTPPTTSTSFFFPVMVGGVQGEGQVVISGYGRTKTVSVNAMGGITVQ